MILRLSVRNLLASKLRLFLTSLSVVLGVGFVVGAFVLGDTVNSAFDGVFETANAGTAVQVRGVETVSAADRQPVPATLLPAVLAVDGVRTAAGEISGTAQIIGSDGEPAGISGPPALGFGWSEDPELNPLTITEGTAPARPGDVVIDRTTADGEDFAVGDRIRIITASGSAEYTMVGIVALGSANDLVGATLAAFTAGTAQRAFDSAGLFTTIGVTADPGVSDVELARRVQAALPASFEAVTGATASEEASEQFKGFVGIFRNALLGFAAIALFVGSFIIFNAFKITVAQRTRQLGLMRAVGASPGQVVRSVLVEAALIGLVASVIGVVFGVVFAAVLRAGFDLMGASLPSTTLQVLPRSIVVGLVVGMLVTFLAALVPAWKASRVPPIAAMHDVTLTGSARARLGVAASLSGLGVGLVLLGLLAPLDALAARFSLIGPGAVLLFVGSAMLTQYVARPLAWIIGAPMARLGLSGRLGRENAMRNPSRTAQTAAALTIGVALVTGVTVFASSLSETYVGTIDTRVRADLLIFSSNQQPFSTAAVAALGDSPELAAVTSWRGGAFKDAAGTTQTLSAVDPAQMEEVFDAGVTTGAMRDLSGAGTIAVQTGYAADNRLGIGDDLTVLFARTGTTTLRIVALFTDTTFDRFFISLDEQQRLFATHQDQIILVRAREGVSPEAARTVAQRELRDFPNLEVRTKAEYQDLVAGQIDGFLRLFYVLLAMAVVIAIFGIVLTLALSVFERTREIGLLRAVGLSRRSVRAMIRWEAMIVALIGALVGVVLGVFLGSVSVSAIPDFDALVIPWGSIVVFLVVAGGFGVLAAIVPARRAARLDILEAIQSE